MSHEPRAHARAFREWLNERAEDVVVLDPEYLDAAALGLAGRADGTEFVVYDSARVVELLMEHEGWDYDDALEWFNVNTAATWAGQGSPAFMEPVPT